MSDGEGNEIDGEEELAAPDWRVRAGSRNKPTHSRLVRALYDGKRLYPSARHKTEE